MARASSPLPSSVTAASSLAGSRSLAGHGQLAVNGHVGRAPLPADDPAADAGDSSPAQVEARVDAELVRRCLDGDDEAFASLVRRYQRKAFWVAYHVLGDIEEARDVAQEAFLRLYRSLQSFDFGRNFYTWFYRIVTNLAIDRLRKVGGVKPTRLDDLTYALPATGEVAVDGASEQTETTGMVWAVLERLDTKFRSVLVLRDIHGLSCREIAPVLKVTHATVRWRLHRGRQLFKDLWERRTRGWR